MFASKDISTAGGGDEDVASVNAVLNSGHLEHFNFNGEPYYSAIVSGKSLIPHILPWQPAER